jgi:hypothetical protein
MPTLPTPAVIFFGLACFVAGSLLLLKGLSLARFRVSCVILSWPITALGVYLVMWGAILR